VSTSRYPTAYTQQSDALPFAVITNRSECRRYCRCVVDRRRALQGALIGLGAVATATGLATLARGTVVIIDAPVAAANVDSEHRFMAAWWTALGPTLWAATPRVEKQERVIRAVAATTFVGGLARLLSARQVGTPHPLYSALTAIELVLPPVLVAWQRSIRDS